MPKTLFEDTFPNHSINLDQHCLSYIWTSNLQPPTCNLQPSTSNLQPPTFEPSTCHLQPLTCNLQLATSRLEPPTGSLQASTSNLQPPTCNLQPQTCNLEPAIFNLQPRTCHLEPATSILQYNLFFLQKLNGSIYLQPTFSNTKWLNTSTANFLFLKINDSMRLHYYFFNHEIYLSISSTN